MKKIKLWSQLDFDNWASHFNADSVIGRSAHADPPSLYPCYVMWCEWPNSGQLDGRFGYVYFNDF